MRFLRRRRLLSSCSAKAWIYRSMTADHKPFRIQPSRAATAQGAGEDRGGEAGQAAASNKLYYDRLPPVEMAEPAGAVEGAPPVAAVASAAIPAASQVEPARTSPAAPQKAAELAPIRPEPEEQPVAAPASPRSLPARQLRIGRPGSG